MTIWEHTGELISRLKIVIVSVFVSGAAIGFFPTDLRALFDPLSMSYTPLASVIMRKIKSDVLPANVTLIAGNIMDTAGIYLLVSLMAGLIVCTPLIAYELYMFINPALYKHERKFVGRFIVSFVVLFLAGATFSYVIVVPITMRVLLWFVYMSGAALLIPLGDFFTQVILLLVALGLFFTFPVFFVLLVKFGVISGEFLTSNRKMIYGAFIVLAVILTADPTPITDMIILVPFIILFEMTVFVSKYVEKSRNIGKTDGA